MVVDKTRVKYLQAFDIIRDNERKRGKRRALGVPIDERNLSHVLSGLPKITSAVADAPRYTQLFAVKTDIN